MGAFRPLPVIVLLLSGSVTKISPDEKDYRQPFCLAIGFDNGFSSIFRSAITAYPVLLHA